MKLVAHIIDGHHVDIRPAPVERGVGPDGAPTPAEAHRTRLRLKPFKTEAR